MLSVTLCISVTQVFFVFAVRVFFNFVWVCLLFLYFFQRHHFSHFWICCPLWGLDLYKYLVIYSLPCELIISIDLWSFLYLTKLYQISQNKYMQPFLLFGSNNEQLELFLSHIFTKTLFEIIIENRCLLKAWLISHTRERRLTFQRKQFSSKCLNKTLFD